jgi:hypothetical protein
VARDGEEWEGFESKRIDSQFQSGPEIADKDAPINAPRAFACQNAPVEVLIG